MVSLRILSFAFVLVAFSAVAQNISQLIGSLSASCQSSAGNLLASDFSQCANIIALVPVIAAPDSILGPFADWVHSSCSITPCPNASVATALASIEKGCADDLAKGVPTAIALSTIISNYAPIRSMICAQHVSSGGFCATTLFSNIEKATKKSVTIALLESVLVGGFSSLVPSLAALPKEETCDDCGKELYITATSIKPSQYSNTTATPPMNSDALVSGVCGASFVDGKHPSSVRQAGPANTSITTNSTKGVADTHGDGYVVGAASTSSGSESKPSCIYLLSLFLLAFLSVFS